MAGPRNIIHVSEEDTLCELLQDNECNGIYESECCGAGDMTENFIV
jgi:hypothetical protein